MLSKLAKVIKNAFRVLGEKGYTLIEMAAVVAVTATLAAVVVPIAADKVKEGKLVAARQDCQQIGTAITSFYKDTSEWPARDGTSHNHSQLLRSGASNGTDPVTVSGDGWHAAKDTSDLLDNHLVLPGGSNKDYLTNNINWKGPYAESFQKRDPWGNNYLVYVKPMYTLTLTGTGTGTAEYGWIISAGPNGTIDTSVTSSSIVTDDIGVMLFSLQGKQ